MRAILITIPLLILLCAPGACTTIQLQDHPAHGWLPKECILYRDETAPPIRAQPPTGMQKHTHHKTGFSFSVDISLDGKYMVYASTFSGGASEIYVKGINRRNPRNISQNTHEDIQPRFSPDGRRVVFASKRSGNWDIYIVPTSGGGPVQQVTETGKDEFLPCWSPDGKSLIYSARSNTGRWEMWIVNLVTQATIFIGEGRSPDWGPHNIIAFERARDEEPRWYAIWTIELELDRDGNITGASPATSVVDGANRWGAINPTWSPDGTKLAFTSVSKSPASRKRQGKFQIDDIWISDLKTGHHFVLAETPDPDWSPRWAMDDRIYFTSFRDVSHNIWSIKALDFEEELLSNGDMR